jgi:hypothetical protein
MKTLLYSLLLVACLFMFGCGSDDKDEDTTPAVYTGGTVSGVTFSVAGPTSIHLVWNEDFPDEDGICIDRRTYPDTWQERLFTLPANTHEFTDSTATLDKVYYYHVYAFKGNAVSAKGNDLQYNYSLPYPANMDYDYDYLVPARMRMFWTNQAPWADSIVVRERIDYGDWSAPVAVLAGNATEYIAYDYDKTVWFSYGYTAYYQDHQSQEYEISFQPVGGREKPVVRKTVR